MDGRKLLEINGILVAPYADKIDNRGEFAEKPVVQIVLNIANVDKVVK